MTVGPTVWVQTSCMTYGFVSESLLQCYITGQPKISISKTKSQEWRQTERQSESIIKFGYRYRIWLIDQYEDDVNGDRDDDDGIASMEPEAVLLGQNCKEVSPPAPCTRAPDTPDCSIRNCFNIILGKPSK